RPRKRGRARGRNGACGASSEAPAQAALEGDVVDHVGRRTREQVLRGAGVELRLGTRRSEGALVASGRQAGGGLAVRLGGLDPGRLVVVAAVHLRDVSGVRKVPQLDAYRQLFAEEDAEPDAQRRNGAEPGVAERAPGDRVG